MDETRWPGAGDPAARAITLEASCTTHPERFVRGPPTPPEQPLAVWINKPIEKEVPTP